MVPADCLGGDRSSGQVLPHTGHMMSDRLAGLINMKTPITHLFDDIK